MADEVVILDEYSEFALGQLCRLTGLHAEAIVTWVEEGLIEPSSGLGDSPMDWRFTGTTLARIQGILRLQHDLALDPAAAALVLELSEEVERLRERVRLLETLLHE